MVACQMMQRFIFRRRQFEPDDAVTARLVLVERAFLTAD
jgi:hypothetical protein